MVDVFNGYISFLFRTKEGRLLEASIAPVVMVLRRLHEANCRGASVPVSKFYNEEVSRSNLAVEYRNWTTPGQRVFSVLQYPFLLTPLAKAIVVKEFWVAEVASLGMCDIADVPLADLIPSHTPPACNTSPRFALSRSRSLSRSLSLSIHI